MIESRADTLHVSPRLTGASAQSGIGSLRRRVMDAVGQLAWWQLALLIAFAGVAYIFASSWLGSEAIAARRGWGGGVPPVQISNPATPETLLVRWDAGYYLQIARDGYSFDGNERAFFPLYPLLVRIISLSGMPLLWSGLLVSIAGFVASSLLLFKLVALHASRRQGLLAVAALVCAPLSFFFLASYAESLYLALSIAAVYFARRGWFIASGFAICMAGAARPQAFILVIPLLLEAWVRRERWRAHITQVIVGLALVPLGTGAFTVWLATQTQSRPGALPYLGSVSNAWQTSITWPWVTLWDGIQAAMFGANINNDWFSQVLVWHDLAFAAAAIALTAWAWKRLPMSIAAYLVIGIVFLFTTHGPAGYALWSITRRLFSLFPMYMAIALLIAHLRPTGRAAVLAASALWLGILGAWFASGRWVA